MLSRRELMAASAGVFLLPRALLAHDVSTAIAEGTTDARLGKAKTLNDYFPFEVPKSLDEWKVRAAAVRQQLKVALGIWPEPVKQPLNPVIHGKVERDGYTIEKVYFASAPGHYVCGNLYRPLKSAGKSPGVLFAHGHWANGRFHDAGERAGKQAVERGEEPELDRGRFFMQAIPVTLARLGFVCFQFDMVGYADSTTIGHVARSGVPHGEGFADAEGELRLQSLTGLQSWNCIRAVDFISSLPDVDASRLGMTGASGGGTQTFLTAAIDERIACAFPAVMVSTAMQGGCVCENCSYLRTGTGNIEFAALMAPRPLAMSGANDWTKEIMNKGYPELKKLYAMYGKEENVLARAWLEYGHNYNRHAREMMYGWMLKHLKNETKTVTEPPYTPTPIKELSVFDAEHPRPKDELKARPFRDKLSADSDAQMAELLKTPAKFREVVTAALTSLVGGGVPKQIAVRKPPKESKPDGTTMHLAVLGRVGGADAIPAAGIFGPKFDGGKACLWIHPKGKASVFDGNAFTSAARILIDAGYAIVAPDLLGCGELAMPKGYPVNETYAGFTFGYNYPLMAHRVHDILTVVSFARTMLKVKTLRMIGWGEAGVASVIAKAVAGDAIDKLAADLNQFRFEAIKDTKDPMLLPGAVKYGGVPAFLGLCAPSPVFAYNHRGTGTGQVSRQLYEAAKAGDRLKREPGMADPKAVAEWIRG